MNTYSNAAKALAVLTFASGVASSAKAVELFDLIIQADGDDVIKELFDEHGIYMWDPVDQMSLMEWSEEINTLAQNYDRLYEEFAPTVTNDVTKLCSLSRLQGWPSI